MSKTVNRENAATRAATVFDWWRRNVPLDVSYRYWRDVHSIAVVRVPGLYQYRLLHLSSNREDVWSSIDGINYTLPDGDRPHGITETLFLRAADQQTFGNSSLNTQYVLKDELNWLFRMNLTCDRCCRATTTPMRFAPFTPFPSLPATL